MGISDEGVRKSESGRTRQAFTLGPSARPVNCDSGAANVMQAVEASAHVKTALL